MRRQMAAIFLLAAATAFGEEKEPRDRALPRIESTAVPTVRTIQGSPLTIWVGDDTSFQVVNSQFPGQGQFYPTNCTQTVADAGIFLAAAGTVFSPAFDDHPCGSSAQLGTPWTPVSISAVTGNGSSASPYRVEVVADGANTGVRLTAVYTYVNGEAFFRISKTVCARTATAVANIYLGGDLYLAGSDAGIPLREPTSGAPGGRDCGQGGYNILFVPTTPATRYSATSYFDTWTQIINGGALSNTVATGCIDNGAALQWSRTINTATCTTVTSAVSFGPIPSVTQFSVGSVNPSEGTPGQTLNVTVSGIGFNQGTRFTFGSGITVNSTTINSSTQATVNLTIAASAALGTRNVVGTSGELSSTAFNAFTVAPPCAPVTAQNVAITFSGRTSGCNPAAGTCQAGETINFAPLFFGRTDTNCDTFRWEFGDGSVSTQKVATHAYSANGRYTVRLTVSNANSTATVTTNVQVGTPGPPPPATLQFTAVPATIELGRTSTLSWSVADATQVTITPEVGTQGPRGSVIVAPRQTTTYTLTASRGNILSTATTTVTVITTPNVVVPRLPPAMVKLPGGPAATASFLVANVGGAPANVTITHASGFFTLSPTSFTLPAFTGQTVTITPTVTAPGAYEITAVVNVGGAPAARVPIRLGIIDSSAGADPQPVQRRVDLSGTSATATATGEARFTNRGTNSVDAIVTTDVPWIIPEVQRVTILPGQTIPVRFRVDRALRGDLEGGIGSLSGSLSLVYIGVGVLSRHADDKIGTGSGSAVSTVTVVDTVAPAITSAGIPALGAGQVALFIPGVGHVQGSVGVFASDLTILHNAARTATNRVEMYYTRAGQPATLLATLPSLTRSSNVLLGDFVATVFSGTNDLGTLQIRATNIDDLSVASVVQNVTGARGNYGSAVPVFRSDRAVAPGESMTLTGLRSGPGVHTNLYIQETSGRTAQVVTEFLNAAGATLDLRIDNVPVFGLTQLVSVVPAGAVSARLTHNAGSDGRFVAYATPVDDLSGDTWTVVDWNRFYGLTATDEKIIPVAGTVHGANNTYFRTDLEVTNLSTTSTGSATFRFVPSSGAPIERTVTLAPRQSVVYLDVVANLFGTTADLVGFIKVLQSPVPLTVSSRTYTTGTDPGTFGSAVPTLGNALALTTGSTLRIAGLEDASPATVSGQRGATFRTNLGLVETRGETVTVRLTLSFSFSAGTRINGSGQASLDVTLAPNQFMQLNGIASRILGPSRDQVGDLKGMELAIQVISGSGGVAVFTSSIDNATGDSILRTE